MVDRVNGYIQQGVWFEQDVRFLSVTVTAAATFLTDLVTTTNGSPDAGELAVAVNSELEQLTEAVATRGTLLGLSVASDVIVNVIVGYGQAYDDAAVLTEVEALIDAINGSFTAAITVEEGFAAAALGTPA